MRMIASLSLALLLLYGCGGGTGARHPMADSDKTMNAFMVSVREYYATRTDGKLGDAIVGKSKVRFIYRYELIKNGHHAEEVALDIFRENIDRETQAIVPAAWRVGAFYPVEGPDPEAIEVRDAITNGLLKRLDTTPVANP